MRGFRAVCARACAEIQRTPIAKRYRCDRSGLRVGRDRIRIGRQLGRLGNRLLGRGFRRISLQIWFTVFSGD